MQGHHSKHDHRADADARDVRTAAGAVSARLLLAQAAELARAGRYREAETLLAGEEARGVGTTGVADLRARIYAQQGQLAEAEALWQEVLTVDAENGAARDGLQRIAALRRGRMFFLPRFLGRSLVLLGCAVALWFWGQRQTDQLQAAWQADLNRALAASRAETLAALPQVVAENVMAAHRQVLAAQVVEKASVPASTPPVLTLPAQPAEKSLPPPAPALPELHLEVPGLLVTRGEARLGLAFEQGLFDSGVELTPDGEVALALLGQQLEPYAQQIEVRVQGCTDSRTVRAGGLYSDNVALGLQRAVVVVDRLRHSGRLPAVMFSLGSTGPCRGGAQTVGAEDLKKNRSAILTLRPNGG